MNRVVITGCSTGFGYQVAQMLAARGDTVFATMRDPDGKNSGPANELRAFADTNNADIKVIDLGTIERNASDETHDGPFLEAMGLTDFVKLKVD